MPNAVSVSPIPIPKFPISTITSSVLPTLPSILIITSHINVYLLSEPNDIVLICSESLGVAPTSVNKFNFPSDQRSLAIKIFNQAKDDQYSFHDYATQLATLLSSNENSLIMFYELLFELAMADGVLHPTEERLLREVPAIFKIRPNLFEEFKTKFNNQVTDAYLILGVNREMSLAEIKKEYQKKRRQFHPDTLISKGLPEELLEKAKEKFIQIQKAYEEIEKQKN